MLALVRSSITAVRNARMMKFRELGDKRQSCDHVRVIFNEATTAGVLDSLKGCTRLLMTEEGDVILKRMGAFLLPYTAGRDASSLEDCRAQLINLYDHPDQYSKKLKHSTVEAGLTGEIVQQVLIRRAQNTLADALYERFLFWVLSGDPIDTEISRPTWNFSKWPTLEQFSIIMSFFECIDMYFDQDANVRMIEWCNYIKRKGAMEERDDHLASRYGKSVDAVHRLAGLCQIIESTSDICMIFIDRFGDFENGSTSNEFVCKCESIFVELYSSCIANVRSFYIRNDVVERAIDIVSGNLEQYRLLMFTPVDESLSTFSIMNKSVGQLATNQANKKERRREKFMKKSYEMEQAILLFDSVLFTLKTLYECRLLKNGASVLRDMCESLVIREYLFKVDRATGPGTKAVTIYIKVLPEQTSSIECQKFINKLAILENSSITMESVVGSCRKLKYYCKNPPIQAVFDILSRPQYDSLNLDLTPLYKGIEEESSSIQLVSDERSHDIDSMQRNESLNTCTSNSVHYNRNQQTMDSIHSSSISSNDNMNSEDTQTAHGSDSLYESDGLINEKSNNPSPNKSACLSTGRDALTVPLSEQSINSNHESANKSTVEHSNISPVIEDRNSKQQPSTSEPSLLKRYNDAYLSPKTASKKSKANSTRKNDSNEQKFSTPIAGRLCRTRLPIARF